MASNSCCSLGYPWTHCEVQAALENVFVSQVSLELTILLAQPPKFESYHYEPMPQAYTLFLNKQFNKIFFKCYPSSPIAS